MTAVREGRLGRFAFPTIYTDLREAVGDGLEVVGGAVTPSERRARSFNLNLPIHGSAGDADERYVGERMRRQIRSLIENSAARLQGLYLQVVGDDELNGWLIVGGGDISYNGQAGLARGDFRLNLTDCYRIALARTHRWGRRLESYDRRLGTVARDYLGSIYNTNFAAAVAATPQALHYLPPGHEAVTIGLTSGILPATQEILEGDIGILLAQPHGTQVSFEIPENRIRQGGVVIFDRRGLDDPALDPRLNRMPNPSAETNLTNITTIDGGEALIRDKADSWAGRYSVRTTTGGGTNPEGVAWQTDTGLALSAGADVAASIRVRVPAGTTVGVRIRIVNTDASATLGDAAAVVGSGRWQEIVPPWMEVAAGKTGDRVEIRVYTLADEIVTFWSDGALVETSQQTVGPYFDGDSDWSDWSNDHHASPSRYYGDPQEDGGWEEVYGPEYALSPDDVPTIQNGLVRVRYWTGGAWKVYQWVAGTGWVEQGAILLKLVSSSGTVFSELSKLHHAAVAEWTPERGVLHVSMSRNPTTGEHADVYITLERGWTGPRFEVYAHGTPGALGAQIAWVCETSGNPIAMFVTGAATGQEGAADDDPSQAWSNTNLGTANGTTGLPVVTLIPPAGPQVTLTVMRASVIFDGITDTGLYGSRPGIAVRCNDGSAQAGYLSAHVNLGQRGLVFEAEAATLGNTASLVADANAAPGSGNSAVEETDTAEDTSSNSLTFAAAAFDDVPLCTLVGVWARIRAVDAAAVVTAKALVGPSGSEVACANPATGAITSQSYTWRYLGSAAHLDPNDRLLIRLWRSSGTGAVRIDRVVAIPLQRRSSTLNQYDGAFDRALSHLYSSRAVPILVAR